MSGLIPLYATVVAALHFIVGADVGASVVETVTVRFHSHTKLIHIFADLLMFILYAFRLHQSLEDIRKSGSSSSHNYIGDKVPANLMLMLIYLYSLRVVHHTLVVDVMESIVDGCKVRNFCHYIISLTGLIKSITLR